MYLIGGSVCLSDLASAERLRGAGAFQILTHKLSPQAGWGAVPAQGTGELRGDLLGPEKVLLAASALPASEQYSSCI